MAHTNSTPNYNLPQFVSSDKPAWLTDVNSAYSAIDTGMKHAQDTADEAQDDATEALQNSVSAASTATSADAKGTGALASIAPTFADDRTYAVNDIVLYNNLLYICTTAVTTPGAWTGSANWSRTTLASALMLTNHPIGSIYMSVDNTNPSAIFGGTWISWGAGRVPVGVDTTQTEFNTVEKTDGSKTVTLTAAQSGVPAHTHKSAPLWAGSSGTGTNNVVTGFPTTNKAGAYDINIETNTPQNATEAHNNLQPYITCYMFKRTA